ncbi:MAG: hypothetical protein HY046_01675 [Acidobacteria bacterium]|nr:hypothetical protein [Acidobacteriota bacterium]
MTFAGIEGILLRIKRMFGLHHFYTSWGFILQLAALFHFVRRRADSYWFFIILMGGYIGALIYIVVEVAPDLGLIGGVFKSQGRKTRIKEVEGRPRKPIQRRRKLQNGSVRPTPGSVRLRNI